MWLRRGYNDHILLLVSCNRHCEHSLHYIVCNRYSMRPVYCIKHEDFSCYNYVFYIMTIPYLPCINNNGRNCVTFITWLITLTTRYTYMYTVMLLWYHYIHLLPSEWADQSNPVLCIWLVASLAWQPYYTTCTHGMLHH